MHNLFEFAWSCKNLYKEPIQLGHLAPYTTLRAPTFTEDNFMTKGKLNNFLNTRYISSRITEVLFKMFHLVTFNIFRDAYSILKSATLLQYSIVLFRLNYY